MEHSSSYRTDILAVIIGTPANIAKLHLFICRGSRAVAVVIIDTAYCLGFSAIGDSVSIVLSGEGCCGRCRSRS